MKTIEKINKNGQSSLGGFETAIRYALLGLAMLVIAYIAFKLIITRIMKLYF